MRAARTELPDVLGQFSGDVLPASTPILNVSKTPRLTDPQAYRSWSRDVSARGARLKRPPQMAWDNGHIAPGEHHADSRFELAEAASPAASAFRKQQVDGRRFVQTFSQRRDRLTSTALAPDRKCIEHDRGKRRCQWAFKEDVAGCEWKHMIANRQRKRGREHEGIKVARVVGDENIGRRSRQILSTRNRQSMPELQRGPDARPPQQPAAI